MLRRARKTAHAVSRCLNVALCGTTTPLVRFFADAAGDAVVRDSGYFASGVKETSDSRLKADERRVETFRFQVPPDDTAFVRYQLHYEHSPLGGPEGRTRLTFLTEQRTIAPRQP